MVNLNRMRQLIAYEKRLKFNYQKKISGVTSTSAAITGMPFVSTNRSKVESGAIELIEVEMAYREVLAELKLMREELDGLLPQLDNPDDIAIIRLRYIDGYDLSIIPEAVHLSERAMFYHLNSAERKLIKMFPEKVAK